MGKVLKKRLQGFTRQRQVEQEGSYKDKGLRYSKVYKYSYWQWDNVFPLFLMVPPKRKMSPCWLTCFTLGQYGNFKFENTDQFSVHVISLISHPTLLVYMFICTCTHWACV